MKDSFYNPITLGFYDSNSELGFRKQLKKNDISLIQKLVFFLFLFNAIYALKDYFFYTTRDIKSVIFQALVVLPIYAILYAIIWRCRSSINVRVFYSVTGFLCLFTVLSQLILTILNGTNGNPLYGIIIIITFASYLFSGVLFKQSLIITPILLSCSAYAIIALFEIDSLGIINLTLIYVMTFLTIFFFKYKIELNMRIAFNQAETLQQEGSELKENYQQANAISELRKDLIAILAHDVRAPIANLNTVLSLSKSNLTPEETLYMMSEIEQQVGKVGVLIDDILFWIKSQSEDTEIKMSQLDLHLITEDLKFMFSDIFEDKKIKFEVDIQNNHAIGHPDMIKAVLRNLISNAIKFSSAGDLITLFSKEQGAKVRIGIKDHGVGMDQETVKNIKKKFSSRLGTNQEKGTGIGLNICEALIKSHKSSLNFESSVGEGTRLTVLCESPQTQSVFHLDLRYSPSDH